MPFQIVMDCSQAIAQKNWKIAFAESATAGRLASEFSLTPDSGAILLGGIVCYDAMIKKELLRVPSDIIDRFTCESSEVTKLLAENLKFLFPADIFVSITGLTAPGGSETPQKPVGTMFIHILFPEKYIQHREVFQGNPEEIIDYTIVRVAELLKESL
jgi:nicotinamide-nucleotide amidase